jgi:hypothetical protein
MKDDLNQANAGWVRAEAYLFADQHDILLSSIDCKGDYERICTAVMSKRLVSFKCTTKGCEFLQCSDGAPQ